MKKKTKWSLVLFPIILIAGILLSRLGEPYSDIWAFGITMAVGSWLVFPIVHYPEIAVWKAETELAFWANFKRKSQ